MRLNVPAIEGKTRDGCGPTSLSMVFKYYKKDFSENKIIKNLELGVIKGDIGTRAVDLALLASKEGFDVTCYSYYMNLYKPDFTKLSKKELQTKINKLLKKCKSKPNRDILNITLKLINAGVDFKIKMPEIKNILSFLRKKIPVMLAVNAKILFETEKLPEFIVTNDMGHFIVITGFSGNNFYYNDPYFGESKKISRDKLFFALSNNVLDSSAYLIALSKR